MIVDCCYRIDIVKAFNSKKRALWHTFLLSKILAISGGGKLYQSDSYLDYARELGVQRILKKPVSREEMLQAVEAILQ